ncbi:uncharacterized protein C2845_PM03G02200 [Panicum miliaceum]|uniref:Uncharacterized protein n=1 Tax=Panicum miliaceum TaxID=4540 RepID=A0A3L6TAE6_PANMI|nr:uncharacterized protein C2845_PM03G02200 [Panicum miliaceum]
MEADESRRGKNPAALSGGHLCHVCGYQYPNPHPSAKLRRSHRKHCGKASPAVPDAEEAAVRVAVAVGERGEGGAGDRNAAERAAIGGGGGEQREGIGASEANGGGAALRGSAGGVDSSAEDKVAPELASPTGAGAQVITTELSENNPLINCGDNESASPEDAGTQTVTSELSENGFVNCSSNSIVNEGDGTESQIACPNGSQTRVEHPAEREDSFDEYQDASPFLHQSDSEDGAAPTAVLPTEINNLNTVSSESSVSANETSFETNGLCKDQFPGETNMTDLSSDSKVGYDSEHGALRLAEPEVNLKLAGPYEHSMNVGNTYTDMVNSKSDKTSGQGDMIGNLNASSLLEVHPLILEPESESTSSEKVQGFMENRLLVLHTMSEASSRPVVGSDSVKLETITNPSTDAMSIGSDLKVICTDNASKDSSMELPTQSWTVADISDDHQPVENSCKKSLESPAAGFQYDLPVTNVGNIPITNVNDLEFTFEEKPQPDIVDENLSAQKTNGFTKEEVCNKQIDPENCTEDQFSLSQKHGTLLTDHALSVKNPFNLDDDRNDDLFELPTDSCYLEVPNSVELRQQVDSTSLMVDQPTVSNPTRMAEAQQCHNSNECILSSSSAIGNGEVICPEGMPASSSSELVNKTFLNDHGLLEVGHTGAAVSVPSQATSMEFSALSMQDSSAVRAEVENMQAKDTSAKEMTAVRSIDGIVMEQATSTTANDAYSSGFEEKKLTEDSAAENEVQHSDHVEKEKQAGGTEVNSVQITGNREENKQTEDTNTKEMNAQFSADDVEDKTQTDDTSAEKTSAAVVTEDSEENMLAEDITAKEMVAAQSTDNVEEKQQPNGIVSQEGNNAKQNEEIAAPGTRLNSGRAHVPLKVLLAEASAENQVKKPSTKERVLSFRRRVSKDSNSLAKSGSPKSVSDDQHWSSPAKLPRKDVGKSTKGRKQPWMPFICCHSVH